MMRMFTNQPKIFRATLTTIFIFLFYCSGCGQKEAANSGYSAKSANAAAEKDDLATIAHAFEQKQSGIFVQAHGFVGKVLDDDTQPPRHQKFLVRLANGQTLLMAHNIDLAPRIDDLKTSDRVYFRGLYEWSEKGGMIHMTHHDPAGRFRGGWIEHNGKRYE